MLRIPYMFMCEDFKWQRGEFSTKNIFDRVEIGSYPTTLDDNVFLVVGVMGDEEDDGEFFSIEIKGKNFKARLPDIEFEFHGYNEIVVFNYNFEGFPIQEPQTTYFNVKHKNKILAQYPVKFDVKVGE